MRQGAFAVTAAFGVVATLAAYSIGVRRASLDPVSSAEAVTRGRYLVQVGGCNDCHTPGYARAGGHIPEERWLVGDTIGYQGPWGTTYPVNLRAYMATMSEDQWVETAQVLESRPPMPWFNLRVMNEPDLRALYRYVRSLPEDDSAVPAFVPPGEKPTTPFLVVAPQQPK